MMEWKTISSIPGLEMNLDGEIRRTNNHKIVPQRNGKIGTRVNGKGYSRGVNSLLRETFPYWWIRELDDDEECKEISDFPDYFITTKGRIYSNRGNKPGWLEPTPSPHPSCDYYYQVCLYYPGETKKFITKRIHTLVGRTFLPWKPPLLILHNEETLPYPEINFLSNLHLGDYKDNINESYEKGRRVPPYYITGRKRCGETGRWV